MSQFIQNDEEVPVGDDMDLGQGAGDQALILCQTILCAEAI